MIQNGHQSMRQMDYILGCVAGRRIVKVISDMEDNLIPENDAKEYQKRSYKNPDSLILPTSVKGREKESWESLSLNTKVRNNTFRHIKAELIGGLSKLSTRKQDRTYIQSLIRWWLQYISEIMNHIFKDPIRRAHHVGASVVVTIDPSHVRRLKIDDMTFFIQRPIENGIILEMHKLNTMSRKRKASQIGDSPQSPQPASVVNDSSNNRQIMLIGSEPLQ